MPDLPPHPDLDQLRRQAKDLLRAAQHGDTDAVERLHAVSNHLILDSAQLVLAREHGFRSWARLKAEVTRREIFDTARRGPPERATRRAPGTGRRADAVLV